MYRIANLEKWKDNEDKEVYRYGLEGDKWICIKLKKGKIAGEHYHKGEAENKNPEVIIFLQGKIRCLFRDVKTKQEKEAVVEKPSRIEIEPFVYHKFKALEESIFLESFKKEALNDKYTD